MVIVVLPVVRFLTKPLARSSDSFTPKHSRLLHSYACIFIAVLFNMNLILLLTRRSDVMNTVTSYNLHLYYNLIIAGSPCFQADKTEVR